MNFLKPIKALLALTLGLTATQLHAQTAEELLQQGKDMFKRQCKMLDSPSATRPVMIGFTKAIELLEQAVAAAPRNQEAHYFLGYAYDKKNAAFGNNMPGMNVGYTIKASHEFEEIIRIAPAYKGEKFILDPYSKITAIWGAQAMAYWATNKIDSARWALREGKARGGFDNLVLTFYRAALENCGKNAIIFSWGDVPTFTYLYLQLLEKRRPDVTVANFSLLHINWYTIALLHASPGLFRMSETDLEKLAYCEWRDSLITIPYGKAGKKMAWIQKSTLEGQYLLQGDRAMLDLLIQNGFKRPVYIPVQEVPQSDYGVNLDDYAFEHFYYNRISPDTTQPFREELYKNAKTFPLDAIATVNPNCDESIAVLQDVRRSIMIAIYLCPEAVFPKAEARQLLADMKRKIPASKYPYLSDEYEAKIEELDKKLSQ